MSAAPMARATAMAPVTASAAAAHLRAMTIADLDAVLAIERSAYAFPWTRGNFVDSLAAGYRMLVLQSNHAAAIIGYYVAMSGVEEMHLLNITVAPEQQSSGWGAKMLDDLSHACQLAGALKLWLEVRRSNPRAQQLYSRYGFATVGLRKAYYPAPEGQREDALVMSLALDGKEQA